MADTNIPPSSFVTSEAIPFFYVSDMIDVILRSIESSLEEIAIKIGEIDLASTDAAAVAAEQEKETEVEATEDSLGNKKEYETSDELKQKELKKIQKFIRQFKTFRILLGPVELVNPRKKSESLFITLGDLPISARYFTQWLTKKLLKREEVVYTLTRFLNDFINELLRDFLNNDSCFNGLTKQKVRLFQSAITSYRDEMEDGTELDNITQAIIDLGRGARLNMENAPRPILNVSGERGVPDGGDQGFEREINYLTYFAGRTQPADRMNGVREEDEERGIFHYAIGRSNGIVKEINFNKTSAPSLKMVRFEQSGYDGLQQLREQYDVNIKTFANTNAFPGSYIYVEPLSFAPNATEDMTDLGIGGYHMIIRSEHTLAPGIAESTITAKWVAEMDQQKEESTGETANIEEEAGSESTPKKCWIEGNRSEASKQ